MNSKDRAFALVVVAALLLVGCSQSSGGPEPIRQTAVIATPATLREIVIAARTGGQPTSLAEYTSPTGAFTVVYPATIANCQASPPGAEALGLVCMNGPSADASDRFAVLSFSRLADGRLSSEDWHQWAEQEQASLQANEATLIRFLTQGRQAEAERIDPSGTRYSWHYYEERDGIGAMLLLSVPIVEKASYSALWDSIRASLDWDSELIAMAAVQPIPIPTGDTVPECLTGCAALGGEAYTDCVAKCLDIEFAPIPVPTSQPSPVRCDIARREYQSCMEMYNKIESVVAKQSMYRTCLDWQSDIYKYCP